MFMYWRYAWRPNASHVVTGRALDGTACPARASNATRTVLHQFLGLERTLRASLNHTGGCTVDQRRLLYAAIWKS